MIVRSGTDYTWQRNTDIVVPGGGYYYDVRLSGGSNLAVAIKVNVARGCLYVIDAIAESALSAPNVSVYAADSSGQIQRNKPIPVRLMYENLAPIFFIPEEVGETTIDVFIEFEIPTADKITLQVTKPNTVEVDAGEKAQIPEYEAYTEKRGVLFASGKAAKYAVLPANSVWTPAFQLQPGMNYIAYMGSTESETHGSLSFKFLKAVL